MEIKTKENIYIAKEAIEAKSSLQKMKGLMFSKGMDGFDAMLFKRCNSIHTFFMNYPLDILFINREMKIVKIIRNLKPWRMTRLYFSAYQALELKGGTLDERVQEGDVLEVICIN
tara:strand:+ start:74 stop:418 length:345 start_codon:yes stop_codon:yes gene_type:complete